jgi:hypothetical protein
VNRRKFARKPAIREYRKLFIIATEGRKTEPSYFGIFNSENSTVRVTCLKSGHNSSPQQVLRKMNARLKKDENRKFPGESWLVVDRDQWAEEQLSKLCAWAKSGKNRGFALSNPKFEYWLLLHFEDGNNIKSAQDCSNRLRRFLPNYDKKVDSHTITPENIDKAISRARKRDNPLVDWPRDLGGTTVYRLVENILKA